MPEKISYEEMLQQLESKGIKVVDGARRLYAALNNGVAADVNGTTGPVRLTEPMATNMTGGSKWTWTNG